MRRSKGRRRGRSPCRWRTRPQRAMASRPQKASDKGYQRLLWTMGRGLQMQGLMKPDTKGGASWTRSSRRCGPFIWGGPRSCVQLYKVTTPRLTTGDEAVSGMVAPQGGLGAPLQWTCGSCLQVGKDGLGDLQRSLGDVLHPCLAGCSISQTQG